MQRKSNQDCFFHEIEVRFLFVDEFVVAEIFQKKLQCFQGARSHLNLECELIFELKKFDWGGSIPGKN